jgi:hypothetical protein
MTPVLPTLRVVRFNAEWTPAFERLDPTVGRRMPVGFQNSAISADLVIQTAASYSLIRPPRTDWRAIRFVKDWVTG